MNRLQPKIAIIGAGNAGTQLAINLQVRGMEVAQIYSRQLMHAQELARRLGHGQVLHSTDQLATDLDFVLITVSDDAVAAVVQTLALNRLPATTYVITAGSVGLEALRPLGDSIAVLYPMQAMSKGRPIDLSTVPVFIEGTTTSLPKIKRLAMALSNHVQEMTSSERMRLHVGAVFAANFVNYMLTCADDIVHDLPGADYRIYLPLLKEIVQRLQELPPHEAQTGPARRGDHAVVLKHIAELEATQRPALAQLYANLSAAIERLYQQPQ